MFAGGLGLNIGLWGIVCGCIKGELLKLAEALLICNAIGLMTYFSGAMATDYWVSGSIEIVLNTSFPVFFFVWCNSGSTTYRDAVHESSTGQAAIDLGFYGSVRLWNFRRCYCPLHAWCQRGRSFELEQKVWQRVSRE